MSWPWKSRLDGPNRKFLQIIPHMLWRGLFRSKVFLIRFPFHNETQRCEIWFEKCLQVLSIKDPFWNLSKRNWTNRNFLGQSLWDQPKDQPYGFLLSKMHIITTQLMESHLLTWSPSSLLFVCHTDASFHLSQWPLWSLGFHFKGDHCVKLQFFLRHFKYDL